MKKRKNIYRIMSTLMVSGILLTNNVVSFADTFKDINNLNVSANIEEKSSARATSSSGKRYFNVYGVSYHNYTEIITVGSNRATGRTTVMANKTVPAGYMGVHCNLYDASTNKVVKTADWTTNSSSAVGYSTNATIDKVGRYYTKGTTKVYNGNGYDIYGANQSPELSTGARFVKLTRDTVRGYFNINENGDTYGTYISDKNGNILQEPDLMEAIGEGGIDGYIKKSDVYDEENEPNTPKEFVSKQKLNRNKQVRIIPLYEKDGKTIIGEYHINQVVGNIVL